MGAARIVFAAFAAALLSAALGTGAARAQNIMLDHGPDRDKSILDGARKEGQVVFYSAMIVNQALRPLADAFMKKYPFVKMTFWRGDTEEIIDKLAAEERAHNVVADVAEGTGVGDLAVGAALTQPYFTPLVAELPERYRDPQNRWTYTRISYFSAAYNTRLVPPGTQPKSYDDLLDPRWRGKLAWRVNTASGTPLFMTAIRLARGEQKAEAYFEKLAQQKMINFGSGSARTLVDRVIAGEFPIALNIFAHHPLISKAKGAPVEFAAHGPGAEHRRHHGDPEGRAPSLCGDAACGLRTLKGGPADTRRRRLFPGPRRRVAAPGARFSHSAARRRSRVVH